MIEFFITSGSYCVTRLVDGLRKSMTEQEKQPVLSKKAIIANHRDMQTTRHRLSIILLSLQIG
jgi:hypothetical protein